MTYWNLHKKFELLMTNVHWDLTFQNWVFLIGGEPNNCSALYRTDHHANLIHNNLLLPPIVHCIPTGTVSGLKLFKSQLCKTDSVVSPSIKRISNLNLGKLDPPYAAKINKIFQKLFSKVYISRVGKCFVGHCGKVYIKIFSWNFPKF